MFGLLNRVLGKWVGKPSLDAIGFDTSGYAFMGEQVPGYLRVWNTPEGDQVGLHLFAQPPDLPAGTSSLDELADFYRHTIDECTSRAGKLVEVSVVLAGDCRAVRTIVSVPQQPSGRTFLGSLTLPFRDFSFVLKCQAWEGGLTGTKETVLLMRRWSNEATPQPLTGDPPWNPDAPEHDAEFPGHPVARARRVLDHLQATLTVAEPVRRLPGFPWRQDRLGDRVAPG